MSKAKPSWVAGDPVPKAVSACAKCGSEVVRIRGERKEGVVTIIDYGTECVKCGHKDVPPTRMT